MRADALARRVAVVVVLLAGTLAGGPVPPAVGSPDSVENSEDVPIPDETSAESSVTVPAGLCLSPVNDVNVAVEWTHNRSADLRFQLRTPAGTLLTLMDGEGTGDEVGGDVLFDDEATSLAEDVDQGPSGSWLRPEEPLSALDGLEPSGTWALEIHDQVDGLAGTLLAWSMWFNCFEPIRDLPFVAVPNPPLLIPELGSAEVSVDVSDCVTVTDVDVEVVFQHSLVSDVAVLLEHAGQEVVLWDPEDGWPRGAYFRFDDEGGKPVEMVTASMNIHNPWPMGYAVVIPRNPLSIFDGGPGDGPWTLRIRDDFAGDQGELQQFGVGVECAGDEPPPSPPPGDLDPVIVLAGAGRVQTAVAVSQENFPDPHTATVAVLATEGNFADALAGTPLAVAATGSVLLTATDQLNTDTADELTRLLPGGATVYLLGGQAALSDTIEQAVTDLGFTPQRLAGASRYDTAASHRRKRSTPWSPLQRGHRRRQRLPGRAGRGRSRPAPGRRAAVVQRPPAPPRHRRRAGRPRPARDHRRRGRRGGLPRPADPQRRGRARRDVGGGRPGPGRLLRTCPASSGSPTW